MSRKVLIGPSSFGALDPSPLERLRDAGYDVVPNPFGRKLTSPELVSLLPGVSGLIAGLETLNREVMKRSDLQVISRCGSGISNVDLNAARELGIRVYSTPEAPVTAVAEATIGSLFSLLRCIPQMSQGMHQRRWEKRIGAQLRGKVVAVIGLGRIGREVGRILKVFGAEVVGTDPLVPGGLEGITILGLPEALGKADIVTLHCSGDGVLLGEREFALMKKGLYLLNAARGGLIEENALLLALESGLVAGAWLDTFAEEPYSGPLCDQERVILTPHIGSYTSECRREMELESVENLIQGMAKE